MLVSESIDSVEGMNHQNF